METNEENWTPRLMELYQRNEGYIKLRQLKYGGTALHNVKEAIKNKELDSRLDEW